MVYMSLKIDFSKYLFRMNFPSFPMFRKVVDTVKIHIFSEDSKWLSFRLKDLGMFFLLFYTNFRGIDHTE